jgi:predicted HAD superfamily Cof-like phosphohydrolase
MKKAFAQVTEFHDAYGVSAPIKPIRLPDDILLLRCELIREEFQEYRQAAAVGDNAAIAKELADLAYVVIGTAVAHGLVQFANIFDEVHRSNMSKLDDSGKPIRREDSKVLKGPNYVPPDLSRFV